MFTMHRQLCWQDHDSTPNHISWYIQTYILHTKSYFIVHTFCTQKYIINEDFSSEFTKKIWQHEIWLPQTPTPLWGLFSIHAKSRCHSSMCRTFIPVWFICRTCDTLHPMVRFVSMATLKSSGLFTSQVIARQCQFLSSIHTCTLQNIVPLETQINI